MLDFSKHDKQDIQNACDRLNEAICRHMISVFRVTLSTGRLEEPSETNDAIHRMVQEARSTLLDVIFERSRLLRTLFQKEEMR